MMEKLKDSRLGRIPKSWEVLQLDQVCMPKQGMRRGPFGGAIKKAFFVEKGYHVYEQRNAIYDNFETVRYFIDEDKFNELKAFQVEANDFIVSCSGTIGKIAKVPENFKEGVINQALLRLRLNRELINDNYFLQQFRSKPFQNKITDSTQGGAMSNLVGMSDFRKTLITLPPLPEQQKIAEILSTVDAKIEIIDEQITETQELKKGFMQRLLTKGIGHTEFKDSPLGEIPKSWEVVKLADISEVKGRIGYRGYTKLDLVEEGKGALAIGGAQITRQNKLSFSKAVYLNWEKYEESPEIKVEVGNIVFAQRGTLGRVALINFLPEKATINPSMVLIKNIDCNERFLFYYLCSTNVQNIVSQISTSTAVPMISQKQIKNFNIGIPSFQEQQKIATILGSVDEKLATLSEKKETYQELKKGLMQQLLTGKIRVK